MIKPMNIKNHKKRFTKTDFVRMLVENSHFSPSHSIEILSKLISDNFIEGGIRGPHAPSIKAGDAAKILIILMIGASVSTYEYMFELLPDGITGAVTNMLLYCTESEKIESLSVDNINFTATILYKNGDQSNFGEIKKYKSRAITEIDGAVLHKLSLALQEVKS